MKKTSSGKPVESTPMDMEEVRRLIDLGEMKGLAEFEIEKAGVRVRIKYARDVAVTQVVAPPPASGASNPTPRSSPATSSAPPPSEIDVQDKNLFQVKSPIVGTFYASSDPNSPPFVKVGDHVKPGQVLCIVEAMKLMNEIESDVEGEIVKVLVENSQAVEYGEPLFSIRTS